MECALGLEGATVHRYHSHMAADTLSRKIARIRALLDARLGLRAPTLEQQAGKVGRTLPRGVIRDLRAVVRADVAQGHPRLGRMMDTLPVAQAADRVEAHLKTIDPKERRKTAVLRTLAKWSALGIAVFVAVVWMLRAQGRI